jgi:anti-sigma regulatory factor (Ser/Thr protein kinase)
MTVPGIDTLHGFSSADSSRVANPSAAPAPLPGRELARMQEWPLHSYLELRALPEFVRSARLHAKNLLGDWGMGALAGTAELLVSEMLTNAVRASAHIADQQRETGQAPGAQHMRLWLTSDTRSVLIQVWDADHHHPVRRDAGPEAEAGRGLLLIEALSTQWGFHVPDGRDGKIVWAVCAP